LLFAFGLRTLTPAYDLNVSQLEDMARSLPASRLEITVHQHLPLYHTEYCLYAHHLSEGRSYRDCGRPCEQHRLALRHGAAGTRTGLEHPVLVDVGCRNTVFNARAQSAAAHVRALVELGVRRLRVELVWESGAEARTVLDTYGALLRGECAASDVARRLGGIERYGVTSGTLAVLA
jgi:putative protease